MKDMMNQKLTLAQVLAGLMATASSVAIVILWVHSTFQSKIDFDKFEVQTERRLQVLESNSNDIKADISFIRGILEERHKKEK